MPSNALLSLSCGHGRVQETKSQNFFEFSLELGPLENSYPSLVSSGPLKDSQMQCWPSALTLAFRRMTALVSCGPVQGRVCNFGAVFALSPDFSCLSKKRPGLLFVQLFACYCRVQTPRLLTCWDEWRETFLMQKKKKIILVSVTCLVRFPIALLSWYVFWYDCYSGH